MSKAPAPSGRRRAVVLVLGDVGRSPRMQFHALSLANQGTRLHLPWICIYLSLNQCDAWSDSTTRC
jgi:hypothetical protein